VRGGGVNVGGAGEGGVKGGRVGRGGGEKEWGEG